MLSVILVMLGQEGLPGSVESSWKLLNGPGMGRFRDPDWNIIYESHGSNVFFGKFLLILFDATWKLLLSGKEFLS